MAFNAPNLDPEEIKENVEVLERYLKAQVRWRLQLMGIPVQECRDCKEPIIFLRTKTGKFMPVTMALQSHFADCPAANKFRKKRYEQSNKN